jgi:two-component system cell cycle sensor histidine kinase/response regulator CckA
MSRPFLPNPPAPAADARYALGILAGGMAHDFNNILAIIDGYSRMLQRQVGFDHPCRAHLDTIVTTAQRGAVLTRQLLAYGRKKTMATGMCDLALIIPDRMELVRIAVNGRARVCFEPHIQTAPVPLHEDDVTDILIELAKNAADAMTDIGTLHIVLEGDDNGAALRFVDDGHGFDAVTAMRALDPFFTTRPRSTHMGLGLYRVDGLVSQSGGTMHLGENTHAAGACVSIHLPYAQTGQQRTAHTGDTKHTILVVDDEPALLDIMADRLRDMGHTVIVCKDPTSALIQQEIHDGPIDVLLTDIVMPGMDGFHFSQLFTSVRPDTRVLYMTGHMGRAMTNPHAPRDAVILNKPVDFDHLTSVLNITPPHAARRT